MSWKPKRYVESCKTCKYWGKCPSDDCRIAQIRAEKYEKNLKEKVS